MDFPKGFKFVNWRYSKPGDPSISGSRYKTEYSAKYDENGVLVLEEVGKTDLYEYIQSFAESCDINMIMARYQAGDTDVLQRVQGFYFDVSNVPDNMPELLNKLNHAETEFNKMPADFKELYGNDFARFICTFDPDQLSQLVTGDDLPGVPDSDDQKEVISDES